jgi:hypothetical protein
MTYSLAPLTADHYAAIVALAPTTPRDSARDGGVSAILTAAQRGQCADCGTVAPLEFAHIAPSAGRMTSDGVVLGAMTCRECNLIHLEVLALSGLPATAPLPYTYARRLTVLTPGQVTRAEAVRAYRAREVRDLREEARKRLAE